MKFDHKERFVEMVLNAVASSDGVGVSGRVTYGVLLYGFAVKMGIRGCAASYA